VTKNLAQSIVPSRQIQSDKNHAVVLLSFIVHFKYHLVRENFEGRRYRHVFPTALFMHGQFRTMPTLTHSSLSHSAVCLIFVLRFLYAMLRPNILKRPRGV